MTEQAEQQGHRRRMQIGYIAPLDERSYDGKTPSYKDTRDAAITAEQVGLDSFWVADHFIYRPQDGTEEAGQWEAFTFLGALAAVTERILLGPLVAATSFRNPALLAKMADSLDEISAGRFILGLGAGWHEPEYTAFGYPFDHLATRFEEALEVIVPLLHDGKVDHTGEYYSARDSVLKPRGPSRQGPPILIGARRPRMLRSVAKYANAWNTAWHTDPAVAAQRWAEMKAVCEEVGRDPGTLQLTVGVLARILNPGEKAREDEKLIAGEPEAIAEALHGFADIGAQHVIFALEPNGVDGMERLGRVLEYFDKK